MRKILTIAACAFLAGCLEPETKKSQSIFDTDLDWTRVKSVKIFPLDQKNTEIDRFGESTASEIDRALGEGMLHWITDSVFVHESANQLFVKEFMRDEPRLHEFPRDKFIFEFIQK